MADFTHGDLSCDFSRTLADEIAESAFLKACDLEARLPVDASGKVNEDGRDAWMRAYCRIAAHSKNVVGVGEWQPPQMFASRQAVQASAILFFQNTSEQQAVAWTEAIYNAFYGQSEAVAEGERSSGSADTDFLASPESTSGNTT